MSTSPVNPAEAAAESASAAEESEPDSPGVRDPRFATAYDLLDEADGVCLPQLPLGIAVIPAAGNWLPGGYHSL